MAKNRDKHVPSQNSKRFGTHIEKNGTPTMLFIFANITNEILELTVNPVEKNDRMGKINQKCNIL